MPPANSHGQVLRQVVPIGEKVRETDSANLLPLLPEKQRAYLNTLSRCFRIKQACEEVGIYDWHLQKWRDESPLFVELESRIPYRGNVRADAERRNTYLKVLAETTSVNKALKEMKIASDTLTRWREDPAFREQEAEAAPLAVRNEESDRVIKRLYLDHLRKHGSKQQAETAMGGIWRRLVRYRQDSDFIQAEAEALAFYNQQQLPTLALNPKEEWAHDVVDLRRLTSDYPKHLSPAKSKLDFSIIENPKMRALWKRYFRARLIDTAPYTLWGYLQGGYPLVYHLNTNHPDMTDFRSLTRPMVEEWMTVPTYKGKSGHVLEVTKLMRAKYVTVLRGMLDYMTRHDWPEAPRRPVLFADDVRQPNKKAPKPIPDGVLDQVVANAHLLIDYPRNALDIMRHVGLRAEDCLHLTEDCIEYDASGDPRLVWWNHKMKREGPRLPVSTEVVHAVNRQRKLVEHLPAQWNKKYLFRTVKGLYLLNSLASAFNNLARRVPIRGANGELYRFTPHQFRHTVGTDLLNKGLGLADVAAYLDHSSMNMTLHYAKLHDETLKNNFKKIVLSQTAVGGAALNALREQLQQGDESELDWIISNLRRQSLPFGYCLHHAKAPKCPHSGACFTAGGGKPCAKLVTTPEFLPILEHNLIQVEENMEIAHEKGWDLYLSGQEETANGLRQVVQELKLPDAERPKNRGGKKQ